MQNSYHLKIPFNDSRKSNQKYCIMNTYFIQTLARIDQTTISRQIQSKSNSYYDLLKSQILTRQIASIARFDKDICKLAQNRVANDTQKKFPLKIQQIGNSIQIQLKKKVQSGSFYINPKDQLLNNDVDEKDKKYQKSQSCDGRQFGNDNDKIKYSKQTIIIKHFTLHTRKKIILRRLKKYVIAIIVVLLFSRTFAKECRKKYRRKSKLNTITQKLITKQKEEQKTNVFIPTETKSPTRVKKKLASTIIRISGFSKLKAQPLFQQNQSFSKSSISEKEEKEVKEKGNDSPKKIQTNLVYRTSQINRTLSEFVLNLKNIDAKEEQKVQSESKQQIEDQNQKQNQKSLKNLEIIKNTKNYFLEKRMINRGHQRAKTEMDSCSKEEISIQKQRTQHHQESLKEFEIKQKKNQQKQKSMTESVKQVNGKYYGVKGVFQKERERQIEQIYYLFKKQNQSTGQLKNNFRISKKVHSQEKI